MMITATACLASKDGIAKLLVSDYHPVLLLWAQFTAIWFVLAPIIIFRHGLRALWPRPFAIQFLRGLFSMLTVLFFFSSIQYIQLAEAHAMVFVGPLLATILSAVILKEPVGRHRIIAVVIGFSGVLLILRPGFSAASLGHFLALGAGVSVAFYFLCNRKAANLAPPLASVANSVSIGMVLLSPALFFIGTVPAWEHSGLFGLFFLIAIAGQSLLVLSFNFGQASLIAPFHYSQIVSSVLVGYLLFNQVPDKITFAGIAIVISCGLYIAYREAR
jgi:drug/metabolite transporter (DMT)-like permease